MTRATMDVFPPGRPDGKLPFKKRPGWWTRLRTWLRLQWDRVKEMVQ